MYKVYQIKQGDTLTSIARANNITEDEIKNLNNNLGPIIPGVYIVLPAFQQNLYSTYMVKPGDTMYSIAQKYSTGLDDLLAINGINKTDFIYPNQQVLVPQNDKKIYVTKTNDSLQDVLTKTGLSADMLIELNDEIMLLPDQVLVYLNEGNI